MRLGNITQVTICLAIFTLMASCTDNRFDKAGWTAKTEPGFPTAQRAKMLDDLLARYQLVGMKPADVTGLLGVPDAADSNYVSFKIVIDYAADIDPVYTKDLYLFVNPDSVVTSYKIVEWKKE